ncbi:hypothetical protein HHI36_004778 [Cryptolaemus montrouzieri]|uniref:Uncharacterized protein n=1 Tax=Cryptolaemus montrouzieri TaxID=559131 RepID=A0ABD2NTS1_9CUCU
MVVLNYKKERQQQRILAWIGDSHDDEIVGGLEDDDNEECLNEVSDHNTDSEEYEDNNHLSQQKQVPGVQYDEFE